MGDVVSLVEKAAETIEQEDAEKLLKKIEKGRFDMDDMAQQLRQMTKMGGLQQMLSLLPGVPNVQDQLKKANVDEKVLARQLAMIESMTKEERRRPEIIKASRRQRIARGSGTTVQDVNKLLKQHLQASKMMKKVKKLGKKGLARGGMQGMLPPGMGGPGGFPR